jgi:hypothetical protein
VDQDPFDTDPDPAFYFDFEPDPAFQFDTYPDPTFDTDPYHFIVVMYLKQCFLNILTWFSLPVGPPGPNHKAYFI